MGRGYSEEDVGVELFNLTLESELLCNRHGIINKLPVVLFLVIVLVIGVIGNGLVFTTSTIKGKRSSCSQFILHLALYDIIACVTIIPVALVGLLQRSIIHHNIICKSFMFLCIMFALSSLVTLDLIAIDRFLKICRPFSYGISYDSSRRLFFLEFITGLVFALATLFFQGVTTIKNSSGPFYCYRGICLLNNDFYESEYRLVFNIMIAVVLAVMFLVLIGCYALVMKSLFQRKSGYLKSLPRVVVTRPSIQSDTQPSRNISISFKLLEKPYPDNESERSVSECFQTTDFCSNGNTEYEDVLGRKMSEGVISQSGSEILPVSAKPSFRRRISAIKSAKILSIVTVSFVLCWLPTWALGAFIRIHVRTAERLIEMSPAHDSAVMFFQFWYLTNHAVNPIIYAFMDHTFRKDCLRLLVRLRLMPSMHGNQSKKSKSTGNEGVPDK